MFYLFFIIVILLLTHPVVLNAVKEFKDREK